MSGRLRIYVDGKRKPELEAEQAGTVELVYSEPAWQAAGLEGDFTAITQRRTVRLGDFDGRVRIEYEPPELEQPAEPEPPREKVEIYASGLTAGQVREYGFDEKPIRVEVPAAVAAAMRGEEPE